MIVYLISIQTNNNNFTRLDSVNNGGRTESRSKNMNSVKEETGENKVKTVKTNQANYVGVFLSNPGSLYISSLSTIYFLLRTLDEELKEKESTQ